MANDIVRSCCLMLALLLLVTAMTISVAPAREWKTLAVTATAYNSTEAQTKKGNIGLAAWGDQLRPGMKAIAVSRDLIAMGLIHETRVRIEGLDGVYIVRDKLHRRWRRRIDIYMGLDVQAAREWGKRDVTIHWRAPP